MWAFSPDGHPLIIANRSGVVRLWNIDTGQSLPATLTGHTDRDQVWHLAPTGTGWPPRGGDETVRLWNADTGQPIGAPLTGHTGSVFGVALAPTGTGWPAPATTTRCGCGTPIPASPSAPPSRTHRRVYGVAFSPDGHRLATASETTRCGCGTPIPANPSAPLTGHQRVRVWRLAPTGTGWPAAATTARCGCGTWRPVKPSAPPLTGHTDRFGVAFSPDGTTSGQGSDDNTVRLWNTETRNLSARPSPATPTPWCRAWRLAPMGIAWSAPVRGHGASPARGGHTGNVVRQAHHQHEPQTMAGVDLPGPGYWIPRVMPRATYPAGLSHYATRRANRQRNGQAGWWWSGRFLLKVAVSFSQMTRVYRSRILWAGEGTPLERAPHVAAVITNLADEAPLVARMKDALTGRDDSTTGVDRGGHRVAHRSTSSAASISAAARSRACTLDRPSSPR